MVGEAVEEEVAVEEEPQRKPLVAVGLKEDLEVEVLEAEVLEVEALAGDLPDQVLVVVAGVEDLVVGDADDILSMDM